MLFKLFAIFLLSFSLQASEKSICGNTDDRILSNEPEVGRATSAHKNYGCTATLIGNSCIISAGHCLQSMKRVFFNVPQSVNTTPQDSKREDIYYADPSFLKYKDNGSGDDWLVAKLKMNPVTGLLPGEAQGYLKVKLKGEPSKGDFVRIAGYGADNTDPKGHFAQQIHSGVISKIGGFFSSRARLGYEVDTMGGNSGSSVVLENTNEIIGVHSHGTCGVFGNYNEGTLIVRNAKFKAAIQECLATEK